MDHKTFCIKLIELQALLNQAIFLDDLPNIEYYSTKIGRFIIRYLDERKSYIKK
jgi:hypothetical protein